MKTYTMMTEMYPGEWWDRFNFHAANQKDADNKADGWAHYQGFDLREVKAVPCTNAWTDTHDEWVQ